MYITDGFVQTCCSICSAAHPGAPETSATVNGWNRGPVRNFEWHTSHSDTEAVTCNSNLTAVSHYSGDISLEIHLQGAIKVHLSLK